jgi:tetratricopeptide (TPR) repeat protein
VEICLALAVAVPPFIFGARQAYGQLVLAILVLASFGFWVIGKIKQGPVRVAFFRPEVCLPLAAVALSVMTWISLPPSLIRTLSPGIARLLPQWVDLNWGAQGGWHTFSVTPGISRDGTLLFILYALMFWITVDTVRRPDEVHRLLRVLFLAGVGVAALGLLHYLFWNGKFYWLWEIWWVEPDRHVRAPFTNRNHFAGYLALALGPGVAVLTKITRDWKNADYCSSGIRKSWLRLQEIKLLFTAAGLSLILAGILLSQSRGGMIVGLMVAAISVAGIINVPWSMSASSHRMSGLTGGTRWGQLHSSRRSGGSFGASTGTGARMLAVGVIVVASFFLAVTFGRQDPFQRTLQMLRGDQSLDEILNDRLKLWKADLHAVKDFPILGCGPGSHQYVCPLYLDHLPQITFTHAENCYLQVLMECGLVGAFILLATLFLLIRWSWHGLQRRRDECQTAVSAALAVTVSLLAALIHATIDFVWYVPAYAATLALLAGLSRSLARMRIEDRRSKIEDRTMKSEDRSSFLDLQSSWTRRWIWGTGLAAVSLGLGMITGTRFFRAAQTEYAWNAYYGLLTKDAKDPAKGSSPQERARWLTLACDHGSTDPDHHLRLGLANLEMFLQNRKQAGKSAGLLQTRKILQQGRFSNVDDAGAWLQRRYGDDLLLLEQAHAGLNRSLSCCPLLGEAYLHLAKLSFLDDLVRPEPKLYWQQAQLVRPNDPDLHLQIGLEQWLAADREAAKTSWQHACALLPSCQSRLLPLLAEQLTVQEIVEFLQLDFDGLKWLTLKELQMGRGQAARFAAGKAQEAIENNPAQARNPALWLAAHELYQQTESPIQAETCLKRALQLAPDRLGIHVLLVRWLMEQGKWRDALAHAQNARRQFPDKPDVQALVNDILAMKVSWVQGEKHRRRTRIDKEE